MTLWYAPPRLFTSGSAPGIPWVQRHCKYQRTGPRAVYVGEVDLSESLGGSRNVYIIPGVYRYDIKYAQIPNKDIDEAEASRSGAKHLLSHR